jgi:hypothetical protein
LCSVIYRFANLWVNRITCTGFVLYYRWH